MGHTQSSNSILMIEPVAFGYNYETGRDNEFQMKPQSEKPQEIVRLARQEMLDLKAALQSKGVAVISFRGKETCPDDVFPNNWLSTTTHKDLIVYPMATPSRSQERRLDILHWLQNEKDYRLLADFSYAEKSGLALEGTGVLIQDHINKQAYVARSQRSNDALLAAWSEKTGYETIVFDTETSDTKQPVYHTNVILHIGTGYAAICPDTIKKIDRARVLDKLGEKHELISLRFPQIPDFCGNALEVSGTEGQRYLALSERAYNALDDKQRVQYLKHIEGFVHAPINALTMANSKPIADTTKMILLRIQTLLLDIDILKLPVFHSHDAVGELIDAAVMRNNDDATFIGQDMLTDKADDIPARIALERGCGFIKYQNIGTTYDGPGDSNSLLLATAEFDWR